MAPLGVRALCTGWLLWQVAAPIACTPFHDDPPSGPTAPVPCDPNWPFSAPRLVQGLENVGTSVGGLRLSPDYLTGYFHAMGVPESVGLDDLYVATRRSVDSPFEQVTPIDGIDINTNADEQAPTVSGDGLTLVFSRGPEKFPSLGGLFVSTRATPDASFLQPIPLPVQTVADAGETPFLLQSGAILYFASMPAPGPLVIDTAGRIDGGFDTPAPIALVPGGSPTSNAWYPAATPDDRTLYFATNRAGTGVDDYDVWVSTRQSSGDLFSTAMPVIAVNSRMADFPTFVSADGCTLYLSSNRSGSNAMYVATKERLASADGGMEASP